MLLRGPYQTRGPWPGGMAEASMGHISVRPLACSCGEAFHAKPRGLGAQRAPVGVCIIPCPVPISGCGCLPPWGAALPVSAPSSPLILTPAVLRHAAVRTQCWGWRRCLEASPAYPSSTLQDSRTPVPGVCPAHPSRSGMAAPRPAPSVRPDGSTQCPSRWRRFTKRFRFRPCTCSLDRQLT